MVVERLKEYENNSQPERVIQDLAQLEKDKVNFASLIPD